MGPSGRPGYPCAPGFRRPGVCRPGFRPGLWSGAPIGRPGTSHSGPGARLVCWCGYPCAPGFRRPGFRPGLWSTGPTARPGTGERPVGAPDHSQGRNPWCVDDRGETLGAPGTSHSGLAARLGGRMQYAPTVVRAFGSLRVSGQLPCPGRGRPQTPGLFYVLIGISVRLHLAFASGFLSVCEGKGLYVRRACQYVILRISSRPCTWPECSFYRRPIYCLSAPYASHGVPEIREP